MKIAIATTGRFHVLDLARELSLLGHDVAFYSYLPQRRSVRFGLPPQCHRGLLFWLFPLLVLQLFAGRRLKQLVDPWLLRYADWLIALRLQPCDIFIGMSGLCIQSAIVARNRYGAKVFIERGSRHILSQKEILDAIKATVPEMDTVPAYAVTRNLKSTILADVVVVPSVHVAKSFTERGFNPDRLFVNPYGVDLNQFVPTPTPDDATPTVIYVGSWSYQKGCDLLSAALIRFNGRVQLLHVGELADAPFPTQTWFQHRDPVPQWQLKDWYSQAHVFVLASRQEGLALVQAQALACGLPVVCTDRTGGSDLASLIGLEHGVLVIKSDDVDALVAGIEEMLNWAFKEYNCKQSRDLLGDARHRLSWAAYGARYSSYLLNSFMTKETQSLTSN